MDVVVIVVAVPIGLLLGGFVTMLADRIPDATPLTLRSRCPYCEHQLGWLETTPIISWFGLGGKCRHCDHPITVGYPIVEALTAALVVAAAVDFGWAWVLLPPLIFVVSCTALSVIDFYVYRLPDRLLFPSLAVSMVAIVFVSFQIDRPVAIGRAVAGMVAYCLFLFVAHLISPRGMGFGDVKLALLLGLHVGFVAGSTYLGWQPTIQLLLWALAIGLVVGAVAGLSIGVLRRVRRGDIVADPEAVDGQPTGFLRQSFPMGPALITGAAVAVFFSDALLGF